MNKKHSVFYILGIAVILILGFILFITFGSPAKTSDQVSGQDNNSPALNNFVRVKQDQFTLDGHAYYFVGANFWQGMELGVHGSKGDRKLLDEELDRLQNLGVTNLRIMASSEGPNTEPHRITPALMVFHGLYDQNVLDGLDFLLSEMGKRRLKAVMVLNNFWYWSGGMAQYVSWHEGTSIPYPGDWDTFMNYSAKFYSCGQCQVWYRNYIKMIIDHVNAYNGLPYYNDPTIFSWELANEPRRYPDGWIDDTAAYIKSLDLNHLVTTGSEGSPPGETIDFDKTHDGPNIDYATIHIWPQNWGWYDPESVSTYAGAVGKSIDYFQKIEADASLLGKPLVLEEFGLARDWEPIHDIYNPISPTTYRDRFYTSMYSEVYDSILKNGPVAGDNFWDWAGQSRPGDNWVGDPPHEPAGWYSVYDTDRSTLAIIASHVVQISHAQVQVFYMDFPSDVFNH